VLKGVPGFDPTKRNETFDPVEVDEEALLEFHLTQKQ